MNPDGVSLSCDDGAHERCPGCSCACHVWRDYLQTTDFDALADEMSGDLADLAELANGHLAGRVGAAGEAPSPGVGDDASPQWHPSVPGVGGSL